MLPMHDLSLGKTLGQLRSRLVRPKNFENSKPGNFRNFRPDTRSRTPPTDREEPGRGKAAGRLRSRIVRTKKLKIPNPGIFNFSPEHETSDTANVTDRTGAEGILLRKIWGLARPHAPRSGIRSGRSSKNQRPRFFEIRPSRSPSMSNGVGFSKSGKTPTGASTFKHSRRPCECSKV